MKKLFMVLVLTIFSSVTFSSDACFDICKSDANQMGLMCQKLRQNCMRMSVPDSTQFEMCMDDVAACLQTGKAINESCFLSCATSDK